MISEPRKISYFTHAEPCDRSSYDIRAIKIAVDRGSKTKHLMLRDIASKNEEQRNRALTTIRFLYGASMMLLLNDTIPCTYSSRTPVFSCVSIHRPSVDH